MEEELSQVLFNCVAGQMTQNLAHHIENLFYLPLAASFTITGRLLWSILCMGMVYSVSYFLLAKLLGKGKGPRDKGFVICFSLVTTLFVYGILA